MKTDHVCYLCGQKNSGEVIGKVRDVPDMSVLKCKTCGLVFLENFDHIDDNFYEDSKMRENDSTKEWEGHLVECAEDDNRRVHMLLPLARNKRILDFGCGGGGFLLGIRDSCSLCAGLEKDRYFRDILKKKGITMFSDIEQVEGKFDVITMFHVLEHLKDPKDMLKKLSKHLTDDGSMIIEVPNPDDALLQLYKNKGFSEFTYWSCHLYLFNSTLLKKLIEDAGLEVNYIKHIQRYPLSNHLYWLSYGKPGGHKLWRFMDSPELTAAYENQLAKIGATDTVVASVSLKKHK